ncbi:heme-binding domain-containing protein [Chlorobium sp. N1]|uniref:heme-binding domain-containing protein n=1 Tax=Chlorobium sp. N1 TaxID=2491138 RepID=UPI00103FC6AD|nr:heme-binding domain-containing protein [Chlorobium sp. N1]TCD47929.1 hypothetical protein E0L29_06530 [Chlorobium sp. N1]
MPKAKRAAAGWAILLLILMQFAPLGRLNPPAPAPLKAPEPVQKALQNACYDCHSFETRWPRAAYVAPASWLIAGTIERGRRALNFSVWPAAGSAEEKVGAAAVLAVIPDAVGHQPLYYAANPNRRPAIIEKEELTAWFGSLRNRQ